MESRQGGTAGKPSREFGSLPIPILRAMVRAWSGSAGTHFSRSVPGGSDDTRRLWPIAMACSRVQRPCRQLSLGLCPATGYIPHTAFVLTEFKTKERQVSDDRAPHPTKCLCPRRSGVLRANPKGKISPETRRKRPHLPTGGLRPLVLHL